MPALAQCFDHAGFTEVKTVLSSGNVVFNAAGASESALQRKIERALQESLGRTFLTIVRPLTALERILQSDPYAGFRLRPGSKRVVTFLRDMPTSKLKLPIALDGERILRMRGREVFSAYVPGPRGPVFMRLIEKTFGQNVTTRTWETVGKILRA
jgi:uncharacterized protein (DUF1697 family)